MLFEQVCVCSFHSMWPMYWILCADEDFNYEMQPQVGVQLLFSFSGARQLLGA
jgi:hypothetical protein